MWYWLNNDDVTFNLVEIDFSNKLILTQHIKKYDC